jgi:hypothetical protein
MFWGWLSWIYGAARLPARALLLTRSSTSRSALCSSSLVFWPAPPYFPLCSRSEPHSVRHSAVIWHDALLVHFLTTGCVIVFHRTAAHSLATVCGFEMRDYSFDESTVDHSAKWSVQSVDTAQCGLDILAPFMLYRATAIFQSTFVNKWKNQ